MYKLKEKTFEMEEARVIFVIDEKYNNKSECSDIMVHSYEACKQYIKDVQWLKETDVETLDLKKTDFIVFEDFTGKDFDKLLNGKCARIVGPWCISVCLLEGRSIPNFNWPIFNVAMRDCYIACSNLPKSAKASIKERVQFMGGCYTESMFDATTHLVTDTVVSEKYAVAVERNIPIMTSKWIEDVWNISLKENVHCSDERFKKHACPPFSNLIISCTGLKNSSDRKKLVDLINENGGQFTGCLNLSTTHILIVCGTSGTCSNKYKAARNECRIKCVTPDWIVDSIKMGYALPHADYTVKTQTSTPTKSDMVDPNFSTISAIMPSGMERTTFEETAQPSNIMATSSFSLINKRKPQPEDIELNDLVAGLSVKQAKIAGEFLDGCSVYLAGFNEEQRDKLCKILNFSGATRYDDICERLTHIIVGDKNCPDMKLIKTKNINCPLVNLGWLIDSLQHKQQVNEDNYLVENCLDRFETDSPVCKKGLSLLRSNRTITEDDLTQITFQEPHAMEVEENQVADTKESTEEFQLQEVDTLENLLKNDNCGMNTQPTLTQEMSEEQETLKRQQLFKSFKFQVLEFENAETGTTVRTHIEEAGGEIVPKSFKGMVDYCVLESITCSDVHRTGAAETVNDIFIEECFQNCDIIDIEYYHRPLTVKLNESVLKNCVVTISGYSGFERIFLNNLIKYLGGIFQEQFARVPSVQKKVVASTHLICSTASGKKYDAALKWNLPALNKEWLLECARTGRYMDERKYLIGDSSVSKRNTETFVSDFNFPKAEKTPKKLSRIKDFEINELNTPSPVKPLDYVKTPETPLGAFINPNPSPEMRKQFQRWLNGFPDFVPPPASNRRKSTPLSELKRRLWSKISNTCGESSNADNIDDRSINKLQATNDGPCSSNENNENVQENEMFLNNQLKEIENFVNSSANKKRSSRAFHSTIPEQAVHEKDSQFTVGWSYSDSNQVNEKASLNVFMMSGLDAEQREKYTEYLENLGGIVSQLKNYDPNATHLITSKIQRNEKTLASMAAGKWVLHDSYVDKCYEAGQFLNEEEFEFGNPKSQKMIGVNFDRQTTYKMESMYYWRKEIQKRKYGAFKDIRAIIVAVNPEQIGRVIEAGDGIIVKKTPPFDENVHATHCFIDINAMSDWNAYIPLAKQGIFCVNKIYVSDFLYRSNKDIKEYILPQFSKYY